MRQKKSLPNQLFLLFGKKLSRQESLESEKEKRNRESKQNLNLNQKGES
jgi:hypothetical protein